ncbi:MAG: HDOD domain-containing protein [Defluviitaleaceae bacterium]|nr:HDOD domain-containing protein [Defluviitaleaceae bacterium]
MNLLFVPKPIFDNYMRVEGYYFSYQYGNALIEAGKSNPFDGAMFSPMIGFMNKVGMEALSRDKMIFIPVTNILLMTNLEQECQVDHNKVVLMMGADILLNDANLSRIKYFKNFGFRFAFRHVNNMRALAPFLPFVDFFFVGPPFDIQTEKISYLSSAYPFIKLIAADISSADEFNSIANAGYALFDGPFYKVHIPKRVKSKPLPPLKVNYIQLLNIVNQDDFDFQTFTRIVRQDTSLAVQFMRLVNSSRRLNSEIKTIDHAAAMLGQREIKKWISTAVSTAMSTDKPPEVTRVSLLRAKLCENLAGLFNMAILKENLFLTGLFSIVDVILDVSMDEALGMIFVPETIRVALSGGFGEFAKVLSFALLYEQGDWYEVSRLAMLQNISIESIHEAFAEAMLWYSNLINTPVDEDVF